MEFRSFSRLLLSVVILLLALEYTSAKCCEGKFLHMGRKMLQVVGNNKPGDIPTSSEEFLESASAEVANLMTRDYTKAMARRKSPIHNSQPND